jgi:hypothetical protein
MEVYTKWYNKCWECWAFFWFGQPGGHFAVVGKAGLQQMLRSLSQWL